MTDVITIDRKPPIYKFFATACGGERLLDLRPHGFRDTMIERC